MSIAMFIMMDLKIPMLQPLLLINGPGMGIIDTALPNRADGSIGQTQNEPLLADQHPLFPCQGWQRI